MLSRTVSLIILFVSVIILLTGHGLQLTLLPLRAQGLGWDVGAIGLTGSFYFLGFLLGCLVIPRFVTAVGHIRTFSTVTTICGAALLAVLLSDRPAIWCLLRLATGIGISGSYIIIESWLNEQCTNENRGRMLSLYTMIVLLSMSLGQLLINIGPPTGSATLVLGSLLLSLAVVPVSLSRVEQPAPVSRLEFRFLAIFRASPAAVGGALTIGTVTGALFTLTPVYAQQAGLALDEIGLVVISMVLGGAVLQLPSGRLSDRFDRRKVMVAMMLLGVAVASVGLLTGSPGFWFLAGTIFLLGGCASAVYPLCLAHANDRSPGHFLQVGTVILLVNSAGAVLGPSLAALVMDALGPRGFVAHILGGMVITLLWVLLSLRRRADTPEHIDTFITTAKSTPALLELDPRAGPIDSPAAAASDADIEVHAGQRR